MEDITDKAGTIVHFQDEPKRHIVGINNDNGRNVITYKIWCRNTKKWVYFACREEDLPE
jgi:hypothetical protein